MYNFRKYLPSFFLHKLTSIYRQNWSCEKIPKSQNSDKATSFSSVVVNIASSVQKVGYSKPLHNKSGCLNTMKSSLTFKVISTWVFLYFQKVLTMKIWQNTQFTTAILFCFIFTAWRGEYLTVIPRAWMGPNGKGNFLREKYFNFVEISSFRENKETKKVVFTSRLYQCKM